MSYHIRGTIHGQTEVYSAHMHTCSYTNRTTLRSITPFYSKHGHTDECNYFCGRAALKAKRHMIKEGKVAGVDPTLSLTNQQVEELLVDIPVSLDGSWISRGADSKHGFVTVISQHTGEVIDRHYMSRVCRACSQWEGADKNSLTYLDWYLHHAPDCLMNHSGSASSMEATGMR